ncbi:MAG: hypothetical protein CMK59_13630 [Proteobacteria bacterium]|nr:hypothetical protein [Pseudomonadota bacterium]
MPMSLDGVNFVPESVGVEMETTDRTTLGKDAFLTLLVAQMQNQDPLEPQSNEEFIAQLSQFSQVEQLMEMNSGFESVFMALNSMNNSSMTQLLGKEVAAFGNSFHYDGSGEVEIHYASSAPSSATKLIVKDQDGSIVWTGAVDPLEEGEGSFTWEARDIDGNPLEEGIYTFSLEGSSTDGAEVHVDELIYGTVDGMSFLEGIPKPSISGIEFDLSMVLRVGMSDEE